MPTLVRYLSEENARKFLAQGEVLFRALSYFRDYEDDGVRSDEFEEKYVRNIPNSETISLA